MQPIYNFSAGPAALPREVMQEAQAEFISWQGRDVSIIEVGHRTEWFMQLAEQAERDLRALLAIPSNYHVLFLAGGASLQFAMVPLNLLGGKTTADYFNTGIWSQKAIAEAKRYCQVNVAVDSASNHFTSVPDSTEWHLNPEAAYVHYTANETISGVEFPFIPEVGTVPLVSDVTSNILSAPLDVSRFGLLYAGAQKNISASGLTIVIVRADLVGNALPFTPTIYNYKVQAENHSLYNTPPTFAWYLAALVFKWLRQQGGLGMMAQLNARKSVRLYQFIDSSKLYKNNIDPRYRSRMNITFYLTKPALEPLFLVEAERAGLLGLRGHRLAGGMRASIYNAMPEAGVDALLTFMSDFERKHN